ncbi:Protein argonaute [Elasticomyces elasticus]|nr:Protein argonaute [Elasticomyces elasticus]
MPTTASKHSQAKEQVSAQESSCGDDLSSSASASHLGSAVSRASSDCPPPAGFYQSFPANLDGNRDPMDVGERNPPTAPLVVIPRNLDLGMGAWSTVHGVNIGSGIEKRGLVMSIWKSKALSKELGPGWIFDGNKLAWSLTKLERELHMLIDLDADKGRPTRPGTRENTHRIVMKLTNTVRFETLTAYLQSTCTFDNACLEAINFSDHLLRELPSQKYTQIKRSFFARGQDRSSLGGGVEAFKGVYQSLRVAHHISGPRLSVNVDVANGTFWTASLLHVAARELCRARDEAALINALRPTNTPKGLRDSAAFALLKRFRKLRVICKHRGAQHRDEHVIDKFLPQNAREYEFELHDKATNTRSKTSLYNYFSLKYSIRLEFPDLPVFRTTKKGTVLPMELCTIVQNQRFPFKMDDRQTANMIKFAVTPPAERWKAIEHGLNMLDWENDNYLKNYGMLINPAQTQVKARLLQNPKVQFGNGANDPRTSGRWDLKGKKFLRPNPRPLKSWGVCVITGRGPTADKATVDRFIQEFVKIYAGHGGHVENKNPAMHQYPSHDAGKGVEETWNKAGNQAQARPQILVFIVPDKDSAVYLRIKRSCECRYGVVSQVMQYAHVQKCQAQYISNVCMKFNAKLGGTTCRAIGTKSAGATGLFSVPTVCIGADVSHAAPGMVGASMAAMTVSTDTLCTRYAAACETNGQRLEMITAKNIEGMLKPLLQHWVGNVGGGRFPKRIFYFRDGVSEGQYQHVLQQEVRDIKALLRTADPKLDIPFVVLVASKRHHIRFFPKASDASAADRNGNPLPGTLVETGVTHPFENDFYLCAHAAIKGTARPVHYHVLLNEANVTNEELQTLLYEHSYQYIRATTPVSLFPAVYYAHLASNRAKAHDANVEGSGIVPSSGSESGGGSKKVSSQTGGSSDDASVDFPQLMPMPNTDGIQSSMWYI